MENKDIWLNISYSPKLIAKDHEAVEESIQNLKKTASELAPSGRIVLFISSEKDKFSTLDKGASNLVLIRKFYNERTFMKDPSVASEFSEIIEHLKAINKIIDKRKNKKNTNKKFKKQEDIKNENN